MPNYSDERLAEMLAVLRDQVAHTRDWHTLDRALAVALIEDIQATRKDIVQLNDGIEKLQEQVEQLNASNQQLAQTIKDMDAVYQRNIERFQQISELARSLRFENVLRRSGPINKIIELADAGQDEESDNA